MARIILSSLRDQYPVIIRVRVIVAKFDFSAFILAKLFISDFDIVSFPSQEKCIIFTPLEFFSFTLV